MLKINAFAGFLCGAGEGNRTPVFSLGSRIVSNIQHLMY
nr:MAG TPA_asm: hypothetical protein [Caudoviricetes sp.]